MPPLATAAFTGLGFVPQPRGCETPSRLPGVAPRRRKALAAVVQEAYVEGVSTRRADELA
jgi:transposase-like protein